MCRNCSEPRVIAALTACSGHKSMHVRCKMASHLDGLLEMSNNLPRALLTNNPQSLEKMFRTAAGLLDEGVWPHVLRRSHTTVVTHQHTCYTAHAAALNQLTAQHNNVNLLPFVALGRMGFV